MKLRRIQITAIPLLIIFCSLSATAQDYEIHLEQISKAGDKYYLSASSSQRVRVKSTSGDQVIQSTDEGFTVEMTADATVLAVDAKGQATSKSFTVTSMKMRKDGTTRQLLPGGSIVLAKLKNGQTLYEMNGKPAEAELAKALSTVIALHSGGSISDEAMFGSQSKRRVGESWNLNIEAIMAFIKELGGQAEGDNIKGRTSLEKVENNHATVRGTMNVVTVLLPFSPDFNAEKGEIHMEFFGRLPLTNSDGSVERNSKVVMIMNGVSRQAPAANEPAVRINIIIETIDSYKMIPVSKK